MNTNLPTDPELRRLVSGMCEGELTDEEVRRLEKRISEDAEALAFYVQYLDVHMSLAWDLAARSAADERSEKPAHSENKQPVVAKAVAFFGQPTPFSMAVAALVMGVLITAMALVAPPVYRAMTGSDAPSETVNSKELVAQLTATHRAVWGDGQIATQRGAHLLAGHRIDLREGLAEITFDNGTVVVLEGPTQFTIDTAMACRMDAGRLSGRVSPQGQGFAVATPLADVVDLGTRFGVVVDESTGVGVHVFEGKVAVRRGPDREREEILLAGEAMQIDAQSAEGDRLTADERSFRQLLPGNDPAAYENWLRRSEELRKHPDLIAYYTMEGLDASSALLVNQADANRGQLDAPLGTQPLRPRLTQGRWPGKGALGFDGQKSLVRLEGSDTTLLGLPEYTLSLWFVQLGTGRELNSGSRGIDATPLILKGYGHGDRKGRDVIFFLGITGQGRLAADYEDAETGGNHPLRGSSQLAPGQWIHAALTCDGREHRLYLNGRLEATLPVAGAAQTRSNAPASLGGAVEGSGDSAGGFAGRIDEVAIFRRALTAREIENLAAE
jgi:hypothetical protein